MPFSIRPLRADEYEAAAALVRRLGLWRSDTAEAWEKEDANRAAAPVPMRRWAAVDEGSGALAGYASAWHMRDRKHRMDVLVDVPFRRGGIGSALLDTVLDHLRGADAATVQARTGDDDAESLRFLHRRGFTEVHRVRELWLDLRAADLAPLAALPARMEAKGIRFVTFAEVADDPQLWEKLTELQNDVMEGWPDPDPDAEPKPFTEDETRRFFDLSWMLWDASFLAVADGRFVGYSGLGRDDPEGGRVESGPTAVHTAYRGRGLATALKVVAAREAQRRGFTHARAQSANPAMIRAGEKVGFRPGRAEVRLLRRLEG